MSPEILIRGDFSNKNYAFLTRSNFGYNKLAEVVPEWETAYEKGSYFVNVGSRVDVAFIGICAMVVDEMFS